MDEGGVPTGDGATSADGGNGSAAEASRGPASRKAAAAVGEAAAESGTAADEAVASGTPDSKTAAQGARSAAVKAVKGPMMKDAAGKESGADAADRGDDQGSDAGLGASAVVGADAGEAAPDSENAGTRESVASTSSASMSVGSDIADDSDDRGALAGTNSTDSSASTDALGGATSISGANATRDSASAHAGSGASPVGDSGGISAAELSASGASDGNQHSDDDVRLRGWLARAGAPEAMSARIVRDLGEGAAQRLADDPWCVLDVPGVGPQAADALAQVVLDTSEPADPRRTRALISWLLRRAAATGGSTVQGADVIAEALAGFGIPDATGAIADAIENGAALAFAVPVELSDDAGDDEIERFEQLDGADDDDPVSMLTSERTLLGLERWVFAEQAAAEAAQRLAATPEAVEAKEGADASGALAGPLVTAAAENGLTLVTGADAARLAELAEAFPAALLTTPSAAGLRTLTEAGADPVDARALADDPGRIAAADVLIVADAQLMGVELAATLLESARDGAHVVLAGDQVTLPSATPGTVFRDLLEIDDPEFGGKLPRVELKRRPTGPLSALTDAVRHGGLPPQELLQGPDGTSKEVVIVPVREAAEAVHRAVQVAADSIPRAFGLSGRQVQVLAVDGGPAADAGAGVKALNAALKARFNPGPGAYAGFDIGDRIIVVSPLPDMGLLGGETGTVRAADADGLIIDWDAPHNVRWMPSANDGGNAAARLPADEDEAGSAPDTAEIQPETETRADAQTQPESGASAGQAGEGAGGAGRSTPNVSPGLIAARQVRALRHAWALTIAEAQGGQWPAVVVVFDGQSAPRLSRAVTLGAIVSATQHLTVIHGAGRALADAVEKLPHRPRRTRLKDALRQ